MQRAPILFSASAPPPALNPPAPAAGGAAGERIRHLGRDYDHVCFRMYLVKSGKVPVRRGCSARV